MLRPRWDFALDVDRSRRQPLYRQIAGALAGEISRGRLKPGDVLPGTRTLAEAVAVNRITVLTAYEELAAEGWITAHPARGCVVANDIPDIRSPRATQPSASVAGAPRYALPPATVVPRSPEHLRGVLVLGASSPDPRLLDVEPLARAYRRALRKRGNRLLGYSDPQGYLPLRTAIAEMLARARGMSASAAHVFITRGSQMAISLAARTLLRPGDLVAVEALGYRQIWNTFAAAGAVLAPVPVDGSGLDTGALGDLVRRGRVAAVYVTPQHQFPTTVPMTPERRRDLLELAQRHGFAVIEDDYDHEFHYDGAPRLPLASLDGGSSVLYVGSFSKLLAPGVRLGFIAGPIPLIERLAVHREYLDMQGDAITEAAVAEMLEDGEVQRHVRRVRGVYKTRRDLLASLLRGAFGSRLAFDVPDGGVALWARTSGIDVEAWARRALERDVAFQTAGEFSFHGAHPSAARLGFACLDGDELREAVRRLRCAVEVPTHGRTA
jgi:GntR family transcriptional regulator / MocR family aminotransferase